MILFFTYLSIITSVNVNFVIFYEKGVEKTVKETYRIYLEQLVKSINRITEPKNIIFKLDHIYAHSEYEHMSKFDELSRFAGSENITNRLDALGETDVTNYIFAISTGSNEDMKKYQIVEPCKINYVLNLESDDNFDRDLLTNLLYGILDVFTKFFGFNVPNLLDMSDQDKRDEFINNVMNSNIEEKLRNCIRKDIEGKKSGNFKNTLKENDDFVSKFDKLLSYLELNNEKNKKKENIDEVTEGENKKLAPIEEPNEKKPTPVDLRPSDEQKGENPEINGNLNLVLKHILSGIEGLEKDVNNLKNKDMDKHSSLNLNERNKRRFSFRPTNTRYYGDFKNEEVSNVIQKKGSPLMPFEFKKNKTEIIDLKPITK